MKVLVTRTDRLGDLVLSLPVVAALKAARPDWEIHLMVAPGSVPLVAHDPQVARLWTWHDGLPAGRQQELEAALRAERFTAAVVLQYRRELAWLLRRAGVPRRYGPWSKWSSWFLLNRGVRQNRSGAGGHEMDHNLDLALRLLADEGVTPAAPPPPPRLHLGPAQAALAAAFRREHADGRRRLVFVHPGSGGSALDWEPGRFAAVANALAADGHRVCITGAGTDAGVIGRLRGDLAPAVSVLLDRYDLADFMAVLSAGDLFIGPSTGPLHMAAALGVPTLGLFPPVRTMHPDRWGPRGPLGAAATRDLVPAVSCPAKRTCLGARCAHFNCLDAVTVPTVVTGATELLNRSRPVGPGWED